MQRISLAITRFKVPLKDCANCLYRVKEWRDGGHCYMFSDEPEGDRCGQFMRKIEREEWEASQ